jgi:hypothetical protein
VVDAATRRFEYKRIEYDIELAASKVHKAQLERSFANRLYMGI